MTDTQPEAVSAETTAADTPPDHLAINPASPFHDADRLARGIGVRFKGVQRHDVDEYCISEDWIRVSLGKKVDRKGQPLTIKLSGRVEVWYLDATPPEDAPAA